MPRYSEDQAREAVASSLSYAEALRKLGLRPVGGNHALFRRYVDEIWKIPTDHFDAAAVARRAIQERGRARAKPLEEVLVERSTYQRRALKKRLLATGLKQPICACCGQSEIWRGRRMALILDHINGVPDDNRLENLRIVCPNCAATFDTHCGRKNFAALLEKSCDYCGSAFSTRRTDQRFCSRDCGARGGRRVRRVVDRPPLDELLADVAAHGYSATGRKHGVSDNAIRKWIRQYERERARGEQEPMAA